MENGDLGEGSLWPPARPSTTSSPERVPDDVSLKKKKKKNLPLRWLPVTQSKLWMPLKAFRYPLPAHFSGHVGWLLLLLLCSLSILNSRTSLRCTTLCCTLAVPSRLSSLERLLPRQSGASLSVLPDFASVSRRAAQVASLGASPALQVCIPRVCLTSCALGTTKRVVLGSEGCGQPR